MWAIGKIFKCLPSAGFQHFAKDKIIKRRIKRIKPFHILAVYFGFRFRFGFHLSTSFNDSRFLRAESARKKIIFLQFNARVIKCKLKVCIKLTKNDTLYKWLSNFEQKYILIWNNMP
jgi:hypothetical protein